MSPMKVPMSNAPKVLSRGGMWGSAAKGSAGIPDEGAAAAGEDAVAMAEGESQHSAMVWCVREEEVYIPNSGHTREIRSLGFGGTRRPLSLGWPEGKAPGGMGGQRRRFPCQWQKA